MAGFSPALAFRLYQKDSQSRLKRPVLSQPARAAGLGYLGATMKKGQYVRLTKLRKSQRCGKLGDSEILLHFALGEPTFIAEKQYQEGRLLQDIKVGGRIYLRTENHTARGIGFLSDEILEIEEDVVLTQSAFYRITTGLLGI